MQNLINLTKESISILNNNNQRIITLHPHPSTVGEEVKNNRTDTIVTMYTSIPLFTIEHADLSRLPKNLDDDTFYIVSLIMYRGLLKEGIKGNFCFPYQTVKKNGKVIGYKSFAVLEE